MGTLGDRTGHPEAMDLIVGLDPNRIGHARVAIDDLNPRPLAGLEHVSAGNVDTAGHIEDIMLLQQSFDLLGGLVEIARHKFRVIG